MFAVFKVSQTAMDGLAPDLLAINCKYLSCTIYVTPRKYACADPESFVRGVQI